MGRALDEGDVAELETSTFIVPDASNVADCQRLADGMGEVCRVMREENLSFDEARLKLVHDQMAEMGVDPTGMPTDPKTFTFGGAAGAGPSTLGRRSSGSLRLSVSPEKKALAKEMVVHRVDFELARQLPSSRVKAKPLAGAAAWGQGALLAKVGVAVAVLLYVLLCLLTRTDATPGFLAEGRPEPP